MCNRYHSAAGLIMKKKLKLKDLTVQSFVTEVRSDEVKGGTAQTIYSCLDYVTCDIVRCYLSLEPA